MARNEENITIEGARIVFRNFQGKEGQYNREGDRNFAVLLDDDFARQLLEDGWNVKWLKPREDDEDGTEQAYLGITVSFKGRPPNVVMISSRGRTTLHEDEVEMLDWVDIRNVDLIFRPYHWVVGDKSGTKAYLKSLFITIEEDELDLKYADIPDQATPRAVEDD